MTYPVPHDAEMRVDHFERVVYYKWYRDGKWYGVKYPLNMFVEASALGHREPLYFPILPIKAPPPPEPAWIGAKRELTEDELLDPALFCRSTYEPYLDRMLNGA